ncbi:PadR family transcriptional regulator [Streptomyces pinistramenti]|uniref:PadR family transcriptional regulator n=1 Tax=Streptomyces pinistramenti TaxID=2884812 RepID=UPI001D064524|nr:helix-turn-helix transcriptional regulator [Streptomyces pinistramenti]
MYGQVRAGTGAPATRQGTVYPLLARLRREELVTTDWSKSPSGPPRRYCTPTPKGRAAPEEFASVWVEFADAVGRVITPDRPPSGKNGEDLAPSRNTPVPVFRPASRLRLAGLHDTVAGFGYGAEIAATLAEIVIRAGTLV